MPASRRSLLVPRILAALLLLAAGAKTYQALHGTPISVVLLVQSSLEAILALWLASGVAARQAAAIALIVFTLFALVSLVEVYTGKSSCACFGPLQVPPVVTFLLDLAIVYVLIVQRPQEPLLGPTLPRRLLKCVCILCVGLAALSVAWRRHQERSPMPVQVFPPAATAPSSSSPSR
ncbi:MAG: hypothetical protein ABR964_10175 [Tepidisphaeraceae bacterium]|jgi:hypothetical protein